MTTYTDGSTAHFESNVHACAARRNQQVVWVRSQCLGQVSQRPYVLRRLGIVADGRVVAVAFVDRRGRVRWHDVWPSEAWEIETPAE